MARCRLCTANDRDALVEDLAAKMWAECENDGRTWEEAGEYWHLAFRRFASAAFTVIQRDFA